MIKNILLIQLLVVHLIQINRQPGIKPEDNLITKAKWLQNQFNELKSISQAETNTSLPREEAVKKKKISNEELFLFSSAAA
ncbi:17147_t:CDS:2 [Cetraspora pellucida]|uniref:17147_t:CDS:1 n=1 Tax=Cetraspora pellucida TaxID=1433469 RepID=A0ACA9KL11_9GLOM|nr:17147_t:CDS:2 [Cetraspora pellucida]